MLTVAGCTQFPELDAAETPGVAQAPYPALVPLDGLLTERAPPQATPEVIDAVQGRAEGLRGRGAALQGQPGVAADSVAARVALLRQKADALRAAE